LFQSSPGTQAGCYWIACPMRFVSKVSILTRHTGRVLHCNGGPICKFCRFQSSPGTQAGCYVVTLRPLRNRISFNPHPAHRPGATLYTRYSCPLHLVSILTRHTGRVLLVAFTIGPNPRLVSILTRHTGRVLRVFTAIKTAPTGFNPHPAHRPGATHSQPPAQPQKMVSILTRHTGRVLRFISVLAVVAAEVSILTRHTGRVLQQRAGAVEKL
jgi:hypothetical protein